MKSGKDQDLILAVIGDPAQVTSGTPAVVVQDEQQREVIASELGRIFFADVHRLSNGVIIIKKAAR